MNFRFTLNDTEIEEPLGFSDITLRIQRDDVYHGIFFEASTSPLGFYGDAFGIIKDALNQDGIDAQVVFKAEVLCEGAQEYEEALVGALNFRSYNESCGNECIIRMNIEQSSCANIFKNRFSQKIDMDSNIAFDGVTAIPSYAALGDPIQLPAQVIPVAVEGFVLDQYNFGRTFSSILTDVNVAIRPSYENQIDNSIKTGNLTSTTDMFVDGLSIEDFPLTPQLLLEDVIQCFDGGFQYVARLKGSITIIPPEVELDIRVRLVSWDGNGDFFSNYVVVNSADVVLNQHIDSMETFTTSFDKTLSGTFSIPYGSGIYAILDLRFDVPILGGLYQINGYFDRFTTFNVSAVKDCPPTLADAYLIHESLARGAEAITDGCITARSDYYGRTDSLPYSTSVDGCGSLRMLTSGLKIRQADEKKFFTSMKDMIDGLRAIDNIGMAIEDNVLRVEPAEWFYKNVEIARFDAIPRVNRRMDETKVVSQIIGGYDKWQIESVKGIDEFNSRREYRTLVKSVANTLDIRSKFIAAGYIIEDLRTLSLIESGSEDSRFDNDTFIIQLRRNAYSGLEVEQGIITSASGMFSPSTVYNWRIRPIYNLIRWWRSIGREIKFSYGEGNYEASGFTSDACSVEAQALAENNDVTESVVKGVTTPIWEPFSLTFDYPLSIREYQNMKAQPYGYIAIQCGDGEFINAYIRSVEYKLSQGQATFNLIPAWPLA